MPVLTQQTALAVGRVKQTNVSTANAANQLIRISKNNVEPISRVPNVETNADDIGKNDEFPDQVFPLNWDTRGPLELFLTSELFAWCAAFSMGGVATTDLGPGSGAYEHVITPQSGNLNLPVFTVVEKAPADGTLIDTAHVGCALNGFSVSLKKGIGRSAATMRADIIGTGRATQPSALALPSVVAMNSLTVGAAVISINGTDYSGAGTLEELDFSWSNNIREEDRFYPGSGSQDNFTVGGRIRHGKRVGALRYVVSVEPGSTEETKLKQQTQGAATITIEGATISGSYKHMAKMEIPALRFASVRPIDVDGLYAFEVITAPITIAANPHMRCTARNTYPAVA